LPYERPKLAMVKFQGDPLDNLIDLSRLPDVVSSSSRKSPSFSPEQRVANTTPMMIHLEEQRRREDREHQKIAKDYARLREEQTGQGSLLEFVRYFWNVLERLRLGSACTARALSSSPSRRHSRTPRLAPAPARGRRRRGPERA
jgi:hypothetical protein